VANILVIDDDTAVLATVELVLKRQGHEVITTTDAYAGLGRLEQTSFDLVIVDIFMPEMDGLEAINQINLRRPGLRVVIMSGYQFEASIAQRPDFLHMATELGAYVSLKKPFRPADLLEAVGKCLVPPADRVAS
jgi:DNA-binding NtrC family response regulator